MRRLAVLLGLPAVLAVAGCGGTSYSYTSGPQSAARSFVAAVTAGARSSWCGDVGAPLYASSLRGPLTGSLRQQCVSQDLFATTGSCDRERAMSGASVSGVTTDGNLAVATLSSGLRLNFRRVGDRWLFDGAAGTASHTGSVSGPCAAD